jgi:hypothetical protein
VTHRGDWPAWLIIATLCVLFCGLAFHVLLLAQGYIIKRYEQETTLSRTRFFQNTAMAFILTNTWRLHKIAHYSLHLFLVWEMPAPLFRRMKSLSDLPDKNDVLKHFSRSELALSVMFGFLVQFLIVLIGLGLFARFYTAF